MKFKTKPMKHQEDMLNRYYDDKCAALFWIMGTGKTKAAIDFLRLKCYQEQKKLTCLVIAPIATLPGWKREFEMHSALGQDVEALLGSRGAKVNKLRKNSSIYLINYESIDSLMPYLKKPWDMLIVDESQKIKSTTTIRSKRCVEISALSRYRLILSGTPILNNPIDIFNQFLVLDRGETFGDNFFHFRNKYFEDVNAAWKLKYPEKYFPKFEPNKYMYEELVTKIRARASIIQEKDSCLDLPPAIYETLELTMPKEIEKAYLEMARDMLAEVDNMKSEGYPDVSVASNAVTKLIRLRQITSGFMVRDSDGKKIRFKTNPKIEAVKDILESIGNNKLVVWACFHEDIDMLVETLKDFNPAQIHGRIHDKQKELNKFMNDDTCRVCIGHPKSGGTGINELVGAKYMLYYSQDYSLESRLQSEARVRRKGSEVHDKITYIDIVYKDSIDELIIEVLKSKEEISTEILTKNVEEIRNAISRK